MGSFEDLLFPLEMVQSSSRIKTAGWGEGRGWNWNDQERNTVGLGNEKYACTEFVVARSRITRERNGDDTSQVGKLTISFSH